MRKSEKGSAQPIQKTINLSLIPNSGHFMLADNPDECYEEIKRFLNTVSEK